MKRLDVWLEERRLIISWRADDDWAAILETFKVMFVPQRERRFDPETRTWSLPRTCEQRLHSWADQWFPRSEQTWDVPEEERTSSRKKKRAGPCPDQRPAKHLLQAYDTLHLLPTAPDELVACAVRILAKQHHPDAGGSTEAMTQINLAAEQIRRARSRAS